MRKSGFIAAVALLVAAIGTIIALAAYFKNRSSYLYEDDDDYLFDDPDDLEYYEAEFDDEDEDELEDAPLEDVASEPATLGEEPEQE